MEDAIEQVAIRLRASRDAVTDDDRAHLAQRFSVSPETHEIMRAPLPPWEPWEMNGATWVYGGNGEVVWFRPRD